MIFHEKFCVKPYDKCDTPQWFALRGNLYKELATWSTRPFDQVFFDFSKPYCGKFDVKIDVKIYVNGKKEYFFTWSVNTNLFKDLRLWMEDVVNDSRLTDDLYMEVEGRILIFHYEHVRLAEYGSRRKYISEDREKDEWEFVDANTAPDTGIFYIYDSSEERIPVVCYCQTKDFLAALYNSLMFYASHSNNVPVEDIDWYYINYNDESNAVFDNWEFYNDIKSPLIELNHDATSAFRNEMPVFKRTRIQETVHMWAEWGNGLFWNKRGWCCGNAEGIFIDINDTIIDLSDLPELRKWYDEFDMSIPEIGRTKEEYEDWYKRGWELAKIVRMRLPESVDLFYQWKSYQIEGSQRGHVEISILVPDERLKEND